MLPSQLGDLQLQVFDQEIAVLELDIATFDLTVCRIERRATLDDQSLQLYQVVGETKVRHPCIVLNRPNQCR